MNNINKNENGITLVELLVVLAIGSIFMLIAINVYLLVQNQYDKQSEEATDMVDITYAAKIITKEIRMTGDPNLIIDTPDEYNQIKIGSTEYKYNSSNKSIEKNGSLFVPDIEKFYVRKIDNKLILEIVSSSHKKIETEIVLRGGE